ncbi:hypothetical protein AAC387_Pa04g1615 [Persea americana]
MLHATSEGVFSQEGWLYAIHLLGHMYANDMFNVGRGDLVVYLPHPMRRMKFLLGEDAEVFKPERWLNNDVVFQPESPLEFTAFQDEAEDNFAIVFGDSPVLQT